jgi:hypothetical protein
MKHIKLYEKKNQELWVVINVPQTGIGDVTIDIFDDQISAENCYIVTVNELAKSNENDPDTIFTLENAETWLTSGDNQDYNIEYKKVYNNGTYKLPKKLKLGRELNKYNL